MMSRTPVMIPALVPEPVPTRARARGLLGSGFDQDDEERGVLGIAKDEGIRLSRLREAKIRVIAQGMG